MGYYGQGTKFFDREILDGIVPKPGGAYIHSGYRHRQDKEKGPIAYPSLYFSYFFTTNLLRLILKKKLPR